MISREDVSCNGGLCISVLLTFAVISIDTAAVSERSVYDVCIRTVKRGCRGLSTRYLSTCESSSRSLSTPVQWHGSKSHTVVNACLTDR